MKPQPKNIRSISLTFLAIAQFLWLGTSCPPVTLKTVELSPARTFNEKSGFAGAQGVCFGVGFIPPEAFSPGPGELRVGFDDYWDPGTQPFPCHNLRNVSYSAIVVFDLSQFDQVASAELLFDAASSFMRAGGQTVGQNPARSCATTLGIATTASSSWPNDNQASLPSSPNINVGVSSQVRDWIGAQPTRPNFGFVLWGPRGQPDPANIWEDSDAQVSMLKNFRLRILYNPGLNPRAPQ